MRVSRSTSARSMRPLAPSRSILGSTRHGANIATGSRPRRLARFSAATPGHGERSSMQKPSEPGAGGSWGRTTSRHSRVAAKAFPGRERASRPRGTTRTVLRCDCQEIRPRFGPGSDESARVLEIRVAADGFLPHMVRNIVGALLQVGQGRRYPEWISELLAGRDRRLGPVAAPPHGLTLSRVGFAGDVLDDD